MATTRGKQRGNVVQIRPLSQQSEQFPLLPLRADAEFPAQFATADLKTIVRAQDGHYYAVKTLRDHPMLPASEFLCYRLASACQIAVPFSTVLTLTDGSQAFGSRFEGGTTEFTIGGPSVGIELFKDSASQVSAILAFDLFVGNEDRHRGNFLFRRTVESKWAPLALDFSRAFLVRNFPNDQFPLPSTCNTSTTIKLMKSADLWRGPHAVFSLGALQQITPAHLDHWCNEMPDTWLSRIERDNLLNWWGSAAFNVRLQALYDFL